MEPPATFLGSGLVCYNTVVRINSSSTTLAVPMCIPHSALLLETLLRGSFRWIVPGCQDLHTDKTLMSFCTAVSCCADAADGMSCPEPWRCACRAQGKALAACGLIYNRNTVSRFGNILSMGLSCQSYVGARLGSYLQ